MMLSYPGFKWRMMEEVRLELTRQSRLKPGDSLSVFFSKGIIRGLRMAQAISRICVNDDKGRMFNNPTGKRRVVKGV